MSQNAVLTDRGVLQVAGDEAQSFLQGLLTNNVDRLVESDDLAMHAGLLTPQGKIMFDLYVVKNADKPGRFWLDCRAEIKADLLKRLTFYKLRAKVELEDVSDRVLVGVCWEEDEKLCPSSGVIALYPDPRFSSLGKRCLLEAGRVQEEWNRSDEALATWHRHRISKGIPEGGLDYDWQGVFPHEANFDLLGGVDFRKGCYVGQEVVSRMQHKTTIRKRLLPVSLSALPDMEKDEAREIRTDKSLIGHLGSVAGSQAIAMIRFDRAAKAMENADPMMVGGAEVHIEQPVWTDRDFMSPNTDESKEGSS